MNLLRWFLPRRSFPDRSTPTFRAYAFMWKPILALIVTEVFVVPSSGTTAAWVFLIIGSSVIGWLTLIGIVDLVRYLMLPNPKRRQDGRGAGRDEVGGASTYLRADRRRPPNE
ncbi:MAG: hypothetical protein JWM18_611 [Chloroflexi bacterium]|jgi:hypothetical protein|nr:hypothetical protein [Chloroflexota bacterium]